MDSNTILFNSKHKIYFPASKNCPAAAVINRGIINRYKPKNLICLQQVYEF